MCSEGTIFATSLLLSDPAEISPGRSIKHIVGNVGHIGMVLMVSPTEPQIPRHTHGVQRITHAQYDGKRSDHFGATSLHLSFTEWKFPLDWSSTGQIDKEAFLLESVVTVRDKVEIVADLDVLELERNPFDVAKSKCACSPESRSLGGRGKNMLDFISLDTWDELLDPPSEGASIFRSNGNWAARLACASILAQKGNSPAMVIVGEGDLCWKCFFDHYTFPEERIPAFIVD